MGNYNGRKTQYPIENNVTPIQVPDVKDVVHDRKCNLCKTRIIGAIFKCVNCKDFCLCSLCEYKMARNTKESVHPSNHTFLKSHYELNFEKCDKIYTDVIFSQVRGKDTTVHPFVICDGCEGAIRGIRFCCLHCPFDYCQNCESTYKLHSQSHCFLQCPYGRTFDPKVIPRSKEYLYKYKHLVSDEIMCSDDEVESDKRRFAQKGIHDGLVTSREMKKDDLDDVVKIEKQSFTFPYTKYQFEGFIEESEESPGTVIPLVVLYDNKVAGYVIGKKKKEWIDEKNILHQFPFDEDDINKGMFFFCHGVSLAINKNLRRKGIAGRLLLECITKCRKLKCDYISLHVAVTNVGAQRLYAKCGFKTLKWSEFYFTQKTDGDYLPSDCVGDALKMILVLSPDLKEKLQKREKELLAVEKELYIENF